jgi:hypothetical protein
MLRSIITQPILRMPKGRAYVKGTTRLGLSKEIPLSDIKYQVM